MIEGSSSLWDREPVFVRWRVATWEHAALHPKSHGFTSRLRESQRLLPEDMTAPIYALLAEAEALVARITEPVPPFDARLLRDVDADDGGRNLNEQVDRLFSQNFRDIMPNWSVEVAKAIGTNRLEIEQQVRSFAALGIPRDDFAIHYGYRLCVSFIRGRDADAKVATHRSLLMGCQANTWQPGSMRDAFDALMR